MTIAGADHDFHLLDYVKLLRRHQWLLAAIFLVTVVTVAVWTFAQVPIFQASATILIEPEAPKILNIQEITSIGSAGFEYYQTQYELIKSRAVVERAIVNLKLKERFPEIGQSRDPYSAVAGDLLIVPKRNTRLVLVKYENRDPALAAEIATGIATAYVRFNVESKLKDARDALTWLTEEMAQLKPKVQESSVALQNYRVKSGILGLEEQRKITAAKIMDFNKAYLEAQAQRLSIEAKFRELTEIARDRSGAQTIFSVADNPLIQKLKGESSDLDVQRSKLLKTYKDQHPEILKIDAQIQQVNQKIDAEMKTMLRAVQTEARVAKAREETLLGNVNQLRREGQDLNEKEIQYQTLQRDSDANQQLYDSVLKRLKETGITGGLESNNVRVVENAMVPRGPIRPRTTFNLALSVAVGFLLAVGVVLTIEYFDTTIKSPDDVERVLGLPLLGVVPMFARR
jgi:succinoglycan biosynthesis transport protein ExoP